VKLQSVLAGTVPTLLGFNNNSDHKRKEEKRRKSQYGAEVRAEAAEGMPAGARVSRASGWFAAGPDFYVWQETRPETKDWIRELWGIPLDEETKSPSA